MISAANSLVGTSAGDAVGLLASSTVIELSDSNFLVRSPLWASSAGAVTFGSGTTGVSGTVSAANSLVGSSPFDAVGGAINSNNVTVLENGNYLVVSPDWDNGFIRNAGAVTFGDVSSGGAVGEISAAISLIGSTTNDYVGNGFRGGLTLLEGGNYVVRSPSWNNGTVRFAGAVTFGSGTSGAQGEVSGSNSLIGSSQSDSIGGGFDNGHVQDLDNGNYVVISPSWNSSSAARVGAVTLGDTSAGGAVGVVSEANSLVGTSARDQVGYSGVTEVGNGNFVVSSRWWDNGSVTDAGALTFVGGATEFVGVVSETNSLVGSSPNDQVSNAGVRVLGNGNYVVRNTFWDNGAATDAGAYTFGDGNAGITGPVNSENSLVGSSSGDGGFNLSGGVGSSFVQVLEGGNYLVVSPGWDNGSATNAGAVTFGDQSVGTTGVISEANSLVGSNTNDFIGVRGVHLLDGGKYLVSSPYWNNGVATEAGAVTFGNENVAVIGAVSPANSLVGSSTEDRISAEVLTSIGGGNYLLNHEDWDNGLAIDAGAVTFLDSRIGIAGVVGDSNSLVGSSSGDAVGRDRPIVLPSGNFLVTSSRWDNGSAENAGAVTFGDRLNGVSGTISATNSLVGSSTDDQLGTVRVLDNGNYIASSPRWDNGSATDAGAVTFGNGNSGVTGVVNNLNSLVGIHSSSFVGGVVTMLEGNNFVVTSNWQQNNGLINRAYTFVSGDSGITGTTSPTNSLFAVENLATNLSRKFDRVQPLVGGNYVVRNPLWDNGQTTDVGAVTFGDASIGGAVGFVGPGKSLVGFTSGDQIGMDPVTALENGNYLVPSDQWDNGAFIDAGAVSFGDASNGGAVGEIDNLNSVIGLTTDALNDFQIITDETTENFYVRVRDGSRSILLGSQLTGFPVIPISDAPAIRATKIDGGGTLPRPDLWQNLAVFFDQDVTITADALSLHNDTLGGAAVDFSAVAFDYDPIKLKATWTFDPVNPLPAAFYTYSLDANLVTANGLPLDGNSDGISGDDLVTRHYVAIPGDRNLDGVVDVVNDVLPAIGNLGAPQGAVWSDGDFNGNGAVDSVADIFLLIDNLNRSVVPTEVVSFQRDGKLVEEIALLERPDEIQTLSFDFNVDVTVEADDLVLLNKTTNTLVPLAGGTFSYHPNGFRATWDLSTLDVPLPAGYYQVSILSGSVANSNNIQNLLPRYTNDFYVALPGDANLDGTVDVVNDVLTMTGNLGVSENVTWQYGDFNNDGGVDLLDSNIVIGSLGSSVAIDEAFAQLEM